MRDRCSTSSRNDRERGLPGHRPHRERSGDRGAALRSPTSSLSPQEQNIMNHLFRSLALVAGLSTAAAAHALEDTPGDILRTFTGDRSIGAFDILSSDVTFDTGANVFLLHAHTAGNIGD